MCILLDDNTLRKEVDSVWNVKERDQDRTLRKAKQKRRQGIGCGLKDNRVIAVSRVSCWTNEHAS